MSKPGLLNALNGDVFHFTATEEAIVKFVINNLKESIHLTIHELSYKTATSAAAISRLCKKLKFRNFREFKIELSKEHERLRFRSTTSEMAKSLEEKMLDSIHHEISTTCNLVDMQQLEMLARNARNAPMVYVYAGKEAQGLSHYLFRKMTEKGIMVIELRDIEHARQYLEMAKRSALFLTLSFLDYPLELSQFLRRSNDLGIQNVLFTCYQYINRAEPGTPLVYTGQYNPEDCEVSSCLYTQLFVLDLFIKNL